MNDLFKLALTFSLRWEGGEKYTNDKDDPGGETKYGISKRAYPDVDIKSLTLAEAEQIYYNDYWLKAGCDKMDKDMAIVVFDSAVNCGVGRTRTWLVELNLRAKEEAAEGKRSARWMIQRRIQYYKDIVVKKPAFNKFLRGWLNRVNDLSKYIDIV
jgi:lysozyme family protein